MSRNAPALVFNPKAWLKWQFLCHAGETEVGCYGLTELDEPLRVVDLIVPKQLCTVVTTKFDDESLADILEEAVDSGLQPTQVGRIWLHTHPGDSPLPSHTDKETFKKFRACDHAVMGILAKGGNTYARLQFSATGGGSVEIAVEVDWSKLPTELAEISALRADWEGEYLANVEEEPWVPIRKKYDWDPKRAREAEPRSFTSNVGVEEDDELDYTPRRERGESSGGENLGGTLLASLDNEELEDLRNFGFDPREYM